MEAPLLALLLITVAVVLGFTDSTGTGASFLGCSCAGFVAPPNPPKAGAAAVPAVWPKLKEGTLPKKDVAGFAVASPSPAAALIVAVVTVVAVVFTNGLLWLKLKDAGAGSGVETGAAKLEASLGAAGFDAVGLAKAVAACVALCATVGFDAAAAEAAAAVFFLSSAFSFVSRITSDLRPTRSGRCGLIT